MATNDYKNGYNDCVEKTTNMLTQMIRSTEDTSDMSLNDMLRLIRQRIWDDAFNGDKPQGHVCSKEYIHGSR